MKRNYRLDSIDLLRGLVIVIMAIDHVRDFMLVGSEQDPMQDPNVGPAIFFTRWITHFCAPVFVLLAGVSAGLMTARKTPAELGGFLLKRGLWLVLVEVAIISTAFTFAPGGIAELGGQTLVVMQVIWAIGAAMVLLGGAQFLGRRSCLWIGIAVVAGHNLLDSIWPASTMMSQGHPVWVALHAQMSVVAGPFLVLFGYPLLPWAGVMLLGFGASPLFELPAPRRDALLLRIGAALVVAFVALRALDVYGDPNHWQVQPGGTVATLLDFLNTNKYPPSLLFLLMTLGPAAMFCSQADRIGGFLRETLVMFGRVPFAFYVAHFYLIHLLAIALGMAQGFQVNQFMNVFLFFPKEGYGLSLPGMYAAWAVVIALLYPLCRWMAALKARRRDWWLSYL